MAADPIQDLTIRLGLDDGLTRSLRQAADTLTEQGRRMGQGLGATTRALDQLDKEGRKSFERLAVGAQESSAAVQKSVAEIGAAAGGGGSVGRQIGQGFEEGAKGVTVLEVSASRLAGTLAGLAAGFFSVSKGIQLLNEGVARSRTFDETYRDLPVLLGLSADAADALAASIRRLAEIRGIPALEALGSVEEAVRNGAGTAAEALKAANDSLALYSAGLARVQDGTKLVTDALSAYGRGVEQADEFTRLIGASLLTTRDNSQALAAGLDRLLPKAARVGASFEDLLSVYGGLRRGGLTLEGSIQALDQTLTQFGSTDFRQKVSAYGEDISRAAIAANGFGATIDRLSASFGQNDDLLGSLSAKGQGLGTVLATLGRSGDSAAQSLDRLRDAQQQFIDAAAAGQQALLAQEGQIRARFDNLVDRVGKGARSATVALAAEAQSLIDTLAQLGSGNASARGVRLFDDGANLEVQALIASADTLEQNLGKVSLAAIKAQEELERLRGEEYLLRGLGVDGDYEAKRTALEKRVANLRAEEERALGELTSARLARDAAAAARIASEAAEAQAQAVARALSADIRFTGLQDSALKAINAIQIPPLKVDLEARAVPESVANAARELLNFASQSANPGDEAQAQAREYLAIVQQFTQAQAQASQLTAQLNAKALDGLERQRAEQEVQLAGIQAVINGLREQGVNVDALTAAFERLRTVEGRRNEEAIAAQAKQIAEQRAALEDRVGSLGGPLETGLSAQFRAIEKEVRAATEQVEKFREARIRAGTATPEELAGLDALTAKAIRLGESLKDAERSKVAARFADSLRDIDSALAGLGSGLRTGLDATLAGIDDNVQGVLDRIAKAREEAANSGAVIDTSALDAAAAKAILLGDALKLDAQAESAREYLSVLADIAGRVRDANIAELPESVAAFAKAQADLLRSQADARRSIFDQAAVLGLSQREAQDLVDRTISAIQREFDANANQLTLDYVLRPQVQIEQERLNDELEKRLAPISKKIQVQIELAGSDGNITPEEQLAIAAAFDEAREAAAAFRKEVTSGAAAFGKGFEAALVDRIRQATDSFAEGAGIAATAFDALGNSLGDAFLAIVDGSKSASEAFKAFVRSFVQQIAQAITQALAFRLVAGSLGFLGLGGPTALAGLPNGGVGFAARGGVFAGEMLPPRAFAEGGIMPGAMQVAGSILHEGKRLPVTNYAVGGIARTPQAAIFAEKPGMAEAFVPLPGPDRGIPVEFKNLPDRARRPQVAEAQPTNVSVSVNYQITALDAAGVREMLVREARTIENVIASAVSSGTNRGLTESVRSAGNPARG